MLKNNPFQIYLVNQNLILLHPDSFINPHTPAAICMISMAGIPVTKYQCFVLCLNRYIPAHVPILPPNKLTRKSIFSGILHAWCFALDLSMPITAIPMIFIIRRYIIRNHILFSNKLSTHSYRPSSRRRTYQEPFERHLHQ